MRLLLRSKTQLAGHTWAFHFKPEAPLTWTAGQFIRVELAHPRPDAEGANRRFTIASAPHEGVVTIATRLTGSSFKQALGQLEPGDTLQLLDPPAGTFVWYPASRPLVFVAQGIGITPFRSMLADRAHHGLPLQAELVFANLNPEIPYEQELQHYPDLTVHYLSSRVTVPMLAELIPDLAQRLIYIAGPKALIALQTPPHNVPARQIFHDQFPNYRTQDY